ncbi:MAG: hypothetical protein JOZ38_07770 [Candidatus Eremiobacteraeota bacterium]|nr:hypothetical protein [Candidatus Eremiobacteraeota bacterium]
MKVRLALLPLFIALIGATSPLSMYVEVKRATLDLLEPVNITLTVHNASKRAINAVFSTTDTYDIRVSSPTGADLWDWAATHTAPPVERHVLFPPGNTTLVTQVWDGLLPDRRSLAPGMYTLHATLADENYRPTVSTSLPFSPPVPISYAKTQALDASVTVGGTLAPSGTVVEVVDSSGTITLDHRIATNNAAGRFVVRGYLTKLNGNLILTIDRWARAFDNLPPSATPEPMRPPPRTFAPPPQPSTFPPHPRPTPTH